MRRLRRYNYRYNETDIEDRAFDYLLNAITKSNKREKTPEAVDYRIKFYLAFLPRHLVNYIIKRLMRKHREVQGQDNLLNTIPNRNQQSIEEVIEECGDLPPRVKDLLLRVAYKGPDERLCQIMSRKDLKLWWSKIRPALKEWAKTSGLAD